MSASKSKGILFPPDQVEQRRLSFGIKLKREVPSTATCTVTSACLVSGNLNNDHKMESSVNEVQGISSSHINCHDESMSNTPDNKQTIDLLSESKNEKNDVGVLDSEKHNCPCPSAENSKFGLFSSLVQYSDDSDNSSTVSDPETNETS